MFERDGRPKRRNCVQVKRPLTIALFSTLAGALMAVFYGSDVQASPINLLPSGKELLLDAVEHPPAPVSAPPTIHEIWHIQLRNFSWPTKTSLDTYWQKQLQNSTIDLDLIANIRQQQARVQFTIFNHEHTQKGFVWLNQSQVIVDISNLPPFIASPKPSATLQTKYLITNPEQAPQVQLFWSTIEQTDPGLGDAKTEDAGRLLTQVLAALPDESVRRVGLAGVAIQFNEQSFENIMRAEIQSLNINRRVWDSQKLMHLFYSGEVHIEPTHWLFSKNLLTGKVTQSFEGGITFHQATGFWGTIRYHRLNFGPSGDAIKLPKVTVDNSKTLAEME